MIGLLPKSLNICGVDYEIRSDFRIALHIFTAYDDPELTDQEKTLIMLECLYVDYDKMPREHLQEAVEKGVWFLDGGKMYSEKEIKPVKLIDWEQDEQIIFPSVNKVSGFETRSVEYLHLWTFLGYFNEIGEGLFSTVVGIREKRSRGKKLEKGEMEFFSKNKNMCQLKAKESDAEIEYKKNMLAMLR